MNAAKVGKQINAKTGRLAEHYKCSICGGVFPAKEVEVDHLKPIVGVEGFKSWDVVIDNLFCEKDGMQVVCKPCHKIKSKKENDERRANKNNNKVS